MGHHSRKSSIIRLCFPLVFFATTALGQGINEVSSLPIITIHPQGGVYTDGNSINLRCGADNDNLPFLFTHNGVPIDENDPGRIHSSDGLTIPSFVAAFEGEYVCQARNRVGNTTFTVASAPALVQRRVLEATLFSSDRSAPYNVTIRVGHPAIIDCASSYTSVPAPTFDWAIYRPFSRPIQASDNIVIGLNGSLYIRNPTSSHNHMGFRCTITNSPMVREGYIQLFVDSSSSPAAAPLIMSPPTDLAFVLKPDRNAEFECIVGGSPLLAVSWTTPVPAHRTYFNPIYNNNRLLAFSLQPSDAGTFTCSASTIGNFSAQLMFIVPPSLATGLHGVTQVIDYGNSLTLNCASNSIAISWYWFRNGTRLGEFSGPQLTIASTVEEDSGSYQCYAINEAGVAGSATYVKVQTIPASITSHLPPQQVMFNGSPVSLSCSATGAPPPTYQWIKDNVPLAESSAQFRVNSETGSLTIDSVDDTYSGVYTCRATNRIEDRVIGHDESSTSLTVIRPTAFTQSLDTEPTLSILLEAEDTLFCDVSKDHGSTLQFSWTKDGQPLVVDGTRLSYVDPLLKNGSIHISRVLNEDAGVYVCTVATTYNGLSAPTISTNPTRVIVTDRPVAPTITDVSSPNSTSVQVIWTITSNLNLIQSFIVEIRLSSSTSGEQNGWTSFRRNPNAVTLQIIGNLVPFTSYEVRVSAVYISVGSEAVVSEPMEVVTMEDLPSGPPKEVTVVAIPSSDTELEIKWQPPSQPNGLITNYTILYRLKESSTTTNFTVTVNGNTTSFILKNLKAQEDYIVRVAASTSVGMGPFSTESLATTGAGTLREPQGSFYEMVWFIVVVTVILLLLIVGIVILALIIKYKITHRPRVPSAGKYHVRPQSGYFGGPGVVDLTDDAAHDYLKRPTEMNAFSSPTNSETLDAVLERETVATTLTDHSMPYSSSRGTPQLPNGPARYMGYSAPEYINPPSFAEAVRNKRSSSRPQSTSSNTDSKPLDWSIGRNSRTGFGYNDPFEKRHFSGLGDDSGPDSSYSVQTYSDGDSVVTDGTEYSHLAGVGQFPRTYHHLQVQTPQNATLV